MQTSDHASSLPLLVAIVGPTGVGKSAIAYSLARHYRTCIISADSRQIYRGMTIGTDAPSQEMLETIPHYFVHTHDVTMPYDAYTYAQEVRSLLPDLFRTHSLVILVGGSMMYVDSVVRGLDSIPPVSEEAKRHVESLLAEGGVASLERLLRELDPEYLSRVDPRNHRRLSRALEVCLSTGKPYTSFHGTSAVDRTLPYPLLKIGITASRPLLFDRIHSRIETMMQRGLLDEAQSLLPYRHLPPLQTIGYREAFSVLDGEINSEECVRKIAKSTRVYAKQQLRWFSRSADWEWFDSSAFPSILARVEQELERLRVRSL